MMRTYVKWAISSAIQLSMVWVLFSQEVIQPARQYRAGDNIWSPTYGIKITMPDNWYGILEYETIVYTLQCDTLNDVTVYLFPSELDLETRMERWKNGIALRPGVVIKAKEELTINQNSLKSSFTPPADKTLKIVGYATHGAYKIGYSMFLTYRQQRKFDYGELLEKLSSFISFEKPTPPSEVSWENRLAGQYLYSYERKARSTRINQLWLCPDGTFKSISKGRGIYKELGKKYLGTLGGTYEISGMGSSGTLTLNFEKAGPFTVQLELREDQVYINGKRFYSSGDNDNECGE